MLLIWPLAAALAGVAGFALARGGICAVAAVRQVVEDRRWRLFASFFECAAWALLALVIADATGVMAIRDWPAHAAISASVAGGAIFGVGALVVGACAFGAAGRLAAGEISFIAVAPGFLAGAWAARRLGADAGPSIATVFPVSGAALTALAAALFLFALWRISTAWRAASTLRAAAVALKAPAWPPELAMAVIAFANIGLLLIVSSWPYTTLLTDIAFSRGSEIMLRAGLAALFLAGAFVGAALARQFKLRIGDLRMWLARLAGGTLMGLGAALVPGGNDALVLLGLPLLRPEALAAYAAMVIVIAAGLLVRQALTKHRLQAAQ